MLINLFAVWPEQLSVLPRGLHAWVIKSLTASAKDVSGYHASLGSFHFTLTKTLVRGAIIFPHAGK